MHLAEPGLFDPQPEIVDGRFGPVVLPCKIIIPVGPQREMAREGEQQIV